MSAVSQMPTRTVVVLCASVRKQRVGRAVADWIVAATPEHLAADVIDLADVELPDDDLLVPGGGEVRSAIADRIDAASGFVVVTPEYNHSFPASLKRAIDWHYREWMFKPAMTVTYGVQGGLLAAEQLRGVFAELSVVTTRRVVGVRAPWEHVDDGTFAPDPSLTEALEAAFAELRWWIDTLDPARTDRPFGRCAP